MHTWIVSGLRIHIYLFSCINLRDKQTCLLHKEPKSCHIKHHYNNNDFTMVSSMWLKSRVYIKKGNSFVFMGNAFWRQINRVGINYRLFNIIKHQTYWKSSSCIATNGLFCSQFSDLNLSYVQLLYFVLRRLWKCQWKFKM